MAGGRRDAARRLGIALSHAILSKGRRAAGTDRRPTGVLQYSRRHRDPYLDPRRRHRGCVGAAADAVSRRGAGTAALPRRQGGVLDFRKGVYYAKGQKRYGQGFDGSFVCLNEARDSLYRRSLLGLR